MKSMFRGNWIKVPVAEFIKEATRTDVFWLGNRIGHDPTGQEIRRFPIDVLEGIFPITQTQTRQCIIGSNIEWMQFIHSCYSLGCVNCRREGWTTIDGKKQLLDNWIETSNARAKADDVTRNPNGKCRFFKYNEAKFKEDNTIITVFDTGRKCRLMVDGLHRAAALTIACEDGINISQVRIVECAGNKVDIIFPCDVHQLPD